MKKRAALSREALLVVVGLITAGLILGVLAFYFQLRREAAAPETILAETVPTAEVEPNAGQIPGQEVLQSVGYTIPLEQGGQMADRVVAKAGPWKLTNGELQLRYLEEIRLWLDIAWEKPDMSRSLESQSCPMAQGVTWQQWFLERAVRRWFVQTALRESAGQPQIIQEEAFQPDLYQDLHGPNVDPKLPVNGFLYADQPCFQPNSIHRAYLDALPGTIEAIVQSRGYVNTEDYLEQIFGGFLSPAELTRIAREYNEAYMYFTEKTYYVEVGEEEVEAYLQLHRGALGEGRAVDLRHILLTGENAGKEAEKIINSWKAEYASYMIPDGLSVNFSRHAFRNSEDEGSNLNGGLYSRVRPGQLAAELDAWCFAQERQVNDYAVLETEAGTEIVFLAAIHTEAELQAREALAKQKEQKLWRELLPELELTVDYGNAALWAVYTEGLIPMEEMLYPDVAHQRYPEAMVFFQQDYPTTSYGSSNVSRGGCGVTTMAMLSTYMTDTLHTPAMLAKAYPIYHDDSGTMAEMFLYVPAELGFQLIKQSNNTDEIAQCLLENKRVVSLQWGGRFTSGGHYLLLQKYYPDDDTFQVRDSNIANYGKLKGHQVDYFTRADVTSGGTNYFIFPEKVTRIPACQRCGDGSSGEIITGYLCEKCTAALERRENFLSILNQLAN